MCLRPDTTRDGLASLEPAVRAQGTVTAGNASPLADGAACALLVDERQALSWGLSALGCFRGYAVAGCPPELMGMGPVLAIPKLLKRHGYTCDDIALFEINEAFGAQMVYCERTLGLASEKVNVNGGAISLGHPFGMTGCRLVGQLLRELRRRRQRLGVVAMCAGGGVGVAALVEAFC
jgi:acetyl-CoA acetyltransferase family protein